MQNIHVQHGRKRGWEGGGGGGGRLPPTFLPVMKTFAFAKMSLRLISVKCIIVLNSSLICKTSACIFLGVCPPPPHLVSATPQSSVTHSLRLSFGALWKIVTCYQSPLFQKFLQWYHPFIYVIIHVKCKNDRMYDIIQRTLCQILLTQEGTVRKH